MLQDGEVAAFGPSRVPRARRGSSVQAAALLAAAHVGTALSAGAYAASVCPPPVHILREDQVPESFTARYQVRRHHVIPLALCTAIAAVAGSCSGGESVGPFMGGETGAFAANLGSVPDSICARLTATITSPTAVTVTYPNRASCAGGYVVIRSANATWSQSGGRTLTLKLRILNRSGGAVPLPVRVTLPKTGIVVLTPAGTPSSKVQATNADSVLPDSSRLWRFGTTGQLAANDSTAAKTLTFNVQSPATKIRLTFATPTTTSGVPALPPDSLPAWVQADSSLDPVSHATKNIVVVLFKPGTSQAQRQTAIDSIHGRVVGGLPEIAGGDGVYYVFVQDDGTGSVLNAAVQLLWTLPQVGLAYRDVRVTQPNYLRPNDGVGWHKADWALSPDSASATARWGFEAISAPYAWGCATGDGTPTVAVLDHNFDAADTGHIVIGAPLLGKAGINPADTLRHGTHVASVLAAGASNNGGMAGMIWYPSLRIYDVGKPLPSIHQVTAAIIRAGREGAQVVNLSYALNEQTVVQLGGAAWVRRFIDTAVVHHIRQAQSTGLILPLIVISAGSGGVDAFLSGYAALKDSFPQNIVVVGATDRNRQRGGASDFGNYVDVFAPGVDVGVMSAQGLVVARTGTSYAAPFVTGIAGLLKAFDPRLTADSIRRLIIAGAAAGARPVGDARADSARYLVNAYESLKLAARRRTAPLCANRVWLSGAANDSLMADRGPDGDEFIASWSIGGFTPGVGHGSHVIGLASAFPGGVIMWQNGTWVIYDGVTPYDPSGAASSLYGMSHERDTTATFTQDSMALTPTARLFVTPSGGSPTQVTTFAGYIANWTGGSHLTDPAAYPPVGREVIVAVRPGNNPSNDAQLFAVSLGTGQQRPLPALPSGVGDIATAISEDGKEYALTYSAPSGTNRLCYLEYHAMADGALNRSITSTANCSATRRGGLSPLVRATR